MLKDIEPAVSVVTENPDLKIIFDPEWNMVGACNVGHLCSCIVIVCVASIETEKTLVSTLILKHFNLPLCCGLHCGLIEFRHSLLMAVVCCCELCDLAVLFF